MGGFDRGAVVIRPDGYLGCLAEGEPGHAADRVMTCLRDVLLLRRAGAHV